MKNGCSAFPVPEFGVGGMTLRDYFAGQALAGLMVSKTDDSPEAIAWMSYQMSDAMIAEGIKP
jgi:hypothetical protein